MLVDILREVPLEQITDCAILYRFPLDLGGCNGRICYRFKPDFPKKDIFCFSAAAELSIYDVSILQIQRLGKRKSFCCLILQILSPSLCMNLLPLTVGLLTQQPAPSLTGCIVCQLMPAEVMKICNRFCKNMAGI